MEKRTKIHPPWGLLDKPPPTPLLWCGVPISRWAVPAYPWWVAGDEPGASYRYTRLDGRATITRGLTFPSSTLEWLIQEVERLDREVPMVQPPPMAGQVWSWQEKRYYLGFGDEAMIQRMWGVIEVSSVGDTGPRPGNLTIPGTLALVWGPSIYGPNVPWAPSGFLAPEIEEKAEEKKA